MENGHNIEFLKMPITPLFVQYLKLNISETVRDTGLVSMDDL